jgi:membrane protease YdiL (CAAX protease family)
MTMDQATLTAWNGLLASPAGWLLTFALVVVVPIRGYLTLHAPPPRDAGPTVLSATKLARYWKTIAWQWVLVAALLLIVRRHGLSAADVGERLGDARVTAGVTAALLAIVVVVFAIIFWRIRRAPPRVSSARESPMRYLAPGFGREMVVFALLSVTAGICEELLYRGWLVNVLRTATGSTGAAVGVGSAIFGIAHAYQGVGGMLRTMFVGLQFALLFVYVDSLIPGQVLHAAFDLAAGLAMATAEARRREARVATC